MYGVLWHGLTHSLIMHAGTHTRGPIHMHARMHARRIFWLFEGDKWFKTILDFTYRCHSCRYNRSSAAGGPKVKRLCPRAVGFRTFPVEKGRTWQLLPPVFLIAFCEFAVIARLLQTLFQYALLFFHGLVAEAVQVACSLGGMAILLLWAHRVSPVTPSQRRFQ